MHIMFDLRSTGLGNNGGSSTLVQSANALIDIGHNVTILDSGANQHTWTELRAPHVIPKRGKKSPSADAVIATGYKSVAPTLSLLDSSGLKMHWIRAWETWQMKEARIIKEVLNVPTIKIVNSICLKNKLKRYNVESYIIRPGYDFDKTYPNGARKEPKGEIILGGLYNLRHKTKRTDWILTTKKVMQQMFPDINIKLFMFGIRQPRHESMKLIDKFFLSPDVHNKNFMFNRVHIWLAPTCLEGLHIVPAEAMMTGCPVVGTNAPMSGMQDYLEHEQTGLVAENEINPFMDQVKRLIKDEGLRHRLGTQAIKKIRSLGSRQENMQKLVDLIENLKRKKK